MDCDGPQRMEDQDVNLDMNDKKTVFLSIVKNLCRCLEGHQEVMKLSRDEEVPNLKYAVPLRP